MQVISLKKGKSFRNNDNKKALFPLYLWEDFSKIHSGNGFWRKQASLPKARKIIWGLFISVWISCFDWVVVGQQTRELLLKISQVNSWWGCQNFQREIGQFVILRLLFLQRWNFCVFKILHCYWLLYIFY